MAIYDTTQLIPNDVVTVVTGMAASMGQFLLTAGAMVKRCATPNPNPGCTSRLVVLVVPRPDIRVLRQNSS